MVSSKADCTFEVVGHSPVDLGETAIRTALTTSVATLEKTFSGDVSGRSVAIFSSAYDTESGTGTYVALESFEGSINGATGTFNFLHVASTTGSDRFNEMFLIVPDSGTGGLAGISGSGRLTIDADGTHRMRFDYSLVRSQREPE